MAGYQSSHTGTQIDNVVNTVQSNTWLTQANAASTYLTQTNAASTYLTQTNANNNFLKITDAENTYLPLIGGQLTGNLSTSAFINTNGAYGIQKWTATTINTSNPTSTSKSITLTTHGRPVFLILSGDINPTSSGGWIYARISRDAVEITSQTCQSPAQSSNVPFCICYLDIVPAGTYDYTGNIMTGNGTNQLGEVGDLGAPQFIAFEI